MPVVRKVLMLLGDIWPRVIPFIELMMMFVYISLICHIIACVLYKSGPSPAVAPTPLCTI